MQWVRDNGGHPTDEVGAHRRRDLHQPAARRWSSPSASADGDAPRRSGVIHLKDVVKEGMRERFDEMRRMGIRTVMITGDNPLTARAIAEEAGVDDFLAEATPEDKMALIKREQEGGRLVAMTGDGTNDAPALAQADVGVAMNTGTSAAKEAGNMVDLDSNPTKLIEIVEIGKQLLITRGSLTTFSIANDVAKYFAIIPAMFAGVYAGLDTLNIMRLATPESAILSAVIFNALIIIGLIPLALRGVRYTPSSAASMLRRNLRDLRPRRHHQPVHRHQAHRPARLHDPRHRLEGRRSMPTRPPDRSASTSPRCATLLVLTVIVGLAYPLAMTGVAQVAFRGNADGSLVHRDGQVVGSDLVGQAFTRPVLRNGKPKEDADGNPGGRGRPAYFQSRPSAAGTGYDPLSTSASNLGPENKDLDRRRQGSAARRPPGSTGSHRRRSPPDALLASGSGLDPHISPAYAREQVARVARERGLSLRPGPGLVEAHTQGRILGFLGEPRVNVLELNLALDALSGTAEDGRLLRTRRFAISQQAVDQSHVFDISHCFINKFLHFRSVFNARISFSNFSICSYNG